VRFAQHCAHTQTNNRKVIQVISNIKNIQLQPYASLRCPTNLRTSMIVWIWSHNLPVRPSFTYDCAVETKRRDALLQHRHHTVSQLELTSLSAKDKDHIVHQSISLEKLQPAQEKEMGRKRRWAALGQFICWDHAVILSSWEIAPSNPYLPTCKKLFNWSGPGL